MESCRTPWMDVNSGPNTTEAPSNNVESESVESAGSARLLRVVAATRRWIERGRDSPLKLPQAVRFDPVQEAYAHPDVFREISGSNEGGSDEDGVDSSVTNTSRARHAQAA